MQWKSRDIPANQTMTYIMILSTSSDFSEVSEFRPIAITCAAGKIFFSVLSNRLQVFMLRNCYISREIQKGFLAGMPGCIEHTFALLEALKDAKDSYRQIIIAWLDLANAYGSVRHNLIQFALNWYHIPKPIQAIIFDYYEKLCAMVTANNWSTRFFFLTLDFSRVVYSPQSSSIACFNCCSIFYDLRNPWAMSSSQLLLFQPSTKHMLTTSLSPLEIQRTCSWLLTTPTFG